MAADAPQQHRSVSAEELCTIIQDNIDRLSVCSVEHGWRNALLEVLALRDIRELTTIDSVPIVCNLLETAVVKPQYAKYRRMVIVLRSSVYDNLRRVLPIKDAFVKGRKITSNISIPTPKTFRPASKQVPTMPVPVQVPTINDALKSKSAIAAKSQKKLERKDGCVSREEIVNRLSAVIDRIPPNQPINTNTIRIYGQDKGLYSLLFTNFRDESNHPWPLPEIIAELLPLRADQLEDRYWKKPRREKIPDTEIAAQLSTTIDRILRAKLPLNIQVIREMTSGRLSSLLYANFRHASSDPWSLPEVVAHLLPHRVAELSAYYGDRRYETDKDVIARLASALSQIPQGRINMRNLRKLDPGLPKLLRRHFRSDTDQPLALAEILVMLIAKQLS